MEKNLMKFMKIFIIILIIIVPTRFLIHTLMSNNVEPFQFQTITDRNIKDEKLFDEYQELVTDLEPQVISSRTLQRKISNYVNNNNSSGDKFLKEYIKFLKGLNSNKSSSSNTSYKNVSNKLVNICEGKPTKFYQINAINIASKPLNDNMDCEWECNNKGDCELYTIDDNTCKMYNLNLDQANENLKKSVSVSCDNKVIPGNNYLGEGKVNNRLYTNNKDSFEYKDYQLDKANSIIGEYGVIDKNIKELKNMTYLNVDDIKRNRNDNEVRYKRVQNHLRDLAKHLDLDKNKIYSNLVKVPEYSADETKNVIFNTGGVKHNVTYDKMLDMINTNDKTNANATSRLNNDKINLKSKQLVYLMLLIVMVISICILFIYKFSPDTISDFKLGVYFSIIILILLFVHYYFKI